MKLRFFSCFIALFLSLAPPAFAKRVALVIGNNDYLSVTKLERAVDDARAVASTLISIGFDVTRLENLKSRDMTRAIFSSFISKIKTNDEVVFYYAGHGIEISSRNYLLAVDIPKVKPGNERFVTKEAFAVDEIIEAIQERGTRLSILILDACRDNPFPKEGTRSIGATRGLGRSDPPKGTFVMYSAGSRQAALDRLGDNDGDPNSVYTRKLLPLLKSPGLKLTEMAKRLRSEVEELAGSVNHDQYPAYYDQMKGEFYFVQGIDQPISPGAQKSDTKNDEQISALQQRLQELESRLQDQKKPLEKKPADTAPLSDSKPEKKNEPSEDIAALEKTPPSRGVSVAEHIEFLNVILDRAGLGKIGLKRSAYGSCTKCVPFIIHCIKPLKSITDLKGMKVRVNNASRDLVKKYGGRPVILPMSEVAPAIKTGIIHCSISGGGQPRYSLNGPLPKGYENKGLPKSHLK